MTPRGSSSSVPHQLSSEVVLGKRYFVASYANDPSIAFRATTATEAVRQLDHHMGDLHRLLDVPRFPAPRPVRPAPGVR